MPTDGGRVHIVLTNSSCAGTITSATVNGQAAPLPLSNANDDPDFKYFDWARVHSDGGTVWFSFHSRNTGWLGGNGDSNQLSVTLGNPKTCWSGDVTVQGGRDVRVSYVTTRNNGAELVAHVHNYADKSTHNIAGLTVNGQPVALELGAGAQANGALGPGDTLVVTHPLSPALKPGDLWAVSLTADDAAAAADDDSTNLRLAPRRRALLARRNRGRNGALTPQGWGGRVMPERFPIQAWTHSSDCPYANVKGGNDKNAQELLAAGIDSVLMDNSKCIGDDASVLATAKSPTHVLAKSKYIKGNTDNVVGVFIGDEVDGKMDSNLRTTDPAQANKQWPQLPTYQGGKTNGHVGSYAGITDVQGMDAYCAACAPTIVPVIHSLPPQYSYDYLKNARDNHAPLPTWMYSQLYSDAWSYQANSPELVMQIGSVVVAGAKGVQLFQSYHDQIQQHDWKSIASALKSISTLREDLRQGDIGGVRFSTSASTGDGGEALVEVIRSPDRVVVAVVSTHATGYSNVLCHTFIDKHWTFHDLTVDKVSLTLPPGVKGLTNGVEVVNGSAGSLQDGAKIDGNEIKNIKFGNKVTVRFFRFDIQQ